MNRIFLFLMVILLMQFVAFTIYYQSRISNEIQKSDEKESFFQEITGRLASEKETEAKELKEMASVAKEKFEAEYAAIASENENLRKQMDASYLELARAKGELDEQKEKLRVMQSSLSQKSADQDYFELKNEIDEAEQKYDDLRVQYEEILRSLIEANLEINQLKILALDLCTKVKDAGVRDERCL